MCLCVCVQPLYPFFFFYRQDARLEHDDVKVDRVEVVDAVCVVVEASKADKHVMLEDFTFLARLLRLDIFRRQRMYAEHLACPFSIYILYCKACTNLANHAHFVVCGSKHVHPPSRRARQQFCHTRILVFRAFHHQLLQRLALDRSGSPRVKHIAVRPPLYLAGVLARLCQPLLLQKRL